MVVVLWTYAHRKSTADMTGIKCWLRMSPSVSHFFCFVAFWIPELLLVGCKYLVCVQRNNLAQRAWSYHYSRTTSGRNSTSRSTGGDCTLRNKLYLGTMVCNLYHLQFITYVLHVILSTDGSHIDFFVSLFCVIQTMHRPILFNVLNLLRIKIR